MKACASWARALSHEQHRRSVGSNALLGDVAQEMGFASASGTVEDHQCAPRHSFRMHQRCVSALKL
jgi:hypothetical protein